MEDGEDELSNDVEPKTTEDGSQENRKSRGKILKVKCGFPGCDAKPMLLQNLKSHTKNQHSSTVPQIQGQQTLQQMFRKPEGVKRKRSPIDNDRGTRAEEQEDVVLVKEYEAEENISGGSCDLNSNKKEADDIKVETNNNLLKEIRTKVESIVSKVVPNLDISDCRTEEDVVFKSLNAIKASVDVVSDISTLKQTLNDFERAAGLKNREEKKEHTEETTRTMKTVDELISEAKSIREIMARAPEFEYRPEESRKEIQCVVCQTTFGYDKSIKQDFSDNTPQSEKFRNIKKNLRHHLDKPSHQVKLEAEEVKTIMWAKEEKRNKAVGLVLGRIVYYIVNKGRPDSDFPLLVYLSAAGGSDCGDLNHSFNFVLGLLPHLAAAVQRRMKNMLGTRLVATGELPPVTLFADKATHQRETRQFVGGITINPGGSNLLVAMLFGIPKCAGGSGDDLAESVLGASDPFAKHSQVIGHVP